jgi:hypothetical protein
MMGESFPNARRGTNATAETVIDGLEDSDD